MDVRSGLGRGQMASCDASQRPPVVPLAPAIAGPVKDQATYRAGGGGPHLDVKYLPGRAQASLQRSAWQPLTGHDRRDFHKLVAFASAHACRGVLSSNRQTAQISLVSSHFKKVITASIDARLLTKGGSVIDDTVLTNCASTRIGRTV
jgi:hypothetical protein